MTNKEKLREIIRKGLASKNKYHTKDLDKLTDDFVDILVNDKRIIVLPCQIGDTVYVLRKDTQKILTGIITAIIQRNTFQYAEIFIEEDKRKTIICLNYLGERIFLTKEEAEKALKGAGGNET